ncbi:MAG: response regulator [Anaerolineales bacterium]|nr:response regulator [Anaerolineales bacterium]
MQELLHLEGYHVIQPADFAEPLVDLRTEKPDAVLIDVNLKGADGLELLGKIRGDQELKDLFVILTSGMDYQQLSIAAGADTFLMKPYPPSELLDILKAHFAQ